jgi:glycosyltransferase involved in cell wall biosynthesis
MNASFRIRPDALSVCMIVKNESATLGRCLASIAPCADELIVVDTGSTDDTADIAASFGARVIRSDWRDDFSYSRNISIGEAACAWILWVDADDVLSAESIPIVNSLKKEKPDRVFGFIVRNQKPGGTGAEFLQARMFPNRPDIVFEHRIHEQMMPSALRLGMRLVETRVIVEHYGYADAGRVRQKAQRNVRLLLAQWDDARPDPVMAIELADSYFALEEFTDAKQWYARLLSMPGDTRTMRELASQACLGMGNILSAEEKYGEAVRFFEQSLEACPGRPDVLFSLAVAHDCGGDLSAAAACLRKVLDGGGAVLTVGIDFRETRIKSYLRLERVLADLGKYDEALVLGRAALDEYPERPEILNMAARVFTKNDLLMDALHMFEKSLRLNTEMNAEAYIGLCQIYVRAGKRETALETMKSIRPLFESRALYWAFFRMLHGAGEGAIIPVSIDRKEIDREAKAISRVYGKGGRLW